MKLREHQAKVLFCKRKVQPQAMLQNNRNRKDFENINESATSELSLTRPVCSFE